MRTRHWLAGIMSGCLALASVGTSNAQPPMPSNGNPDQVGMGMLPAPYNNTYGPPQQNAGANAPGYPPGAMPWPAVSPFAGPPVDSTAYQNGFWYNRTRQGSRQFYYSVDAIFGHSSKPSTTLIGANNVNYLSSDAVTGTLGATGATGTTSLVGATQFNQTIFATGPSRSVNATGNTGTGTGGANVAIPIFADQNTGVLGDVLTSAGMRGSWGWFNNDDSGFVMSGFSLGRSTSAWQLADPSLVINPNSQNYNPTLGLHAWFGLPLSGADTDNTAKGLIADGAVQPYDMNVTVAFSSRLAGGNSDWYFTPIFEGEKMKFRPLAGARYIRLQEDFLFDGYDSGLSYTVNGASSASATGGTGATNATAGYLTPTAINNVFYSTPNVLHSRLDSATLSNMGGPELGLRLDLGGKKFQFWMQSKVGLLANVTQRQISGFGIGNAFNVIAPNTVPAMPNDPSKTAFSSSQMTTTMSPMFEQQFNVKMPIFQLVPYLNKLEAFERAQLTAGYTFLYLQDIYRPQNTINWTQYPVAPSLTGQKSNFMNSMFNIGVEWQY